MRVEKKQQLQKLRRWRIRKKVSGTKECPRMSVRFTNQNIYVQFIDDQVGKTLASTSTVSKNIPDKEKLSANVKSAQAIGKIAAEVAKAAGINKVTFDRSGARYHGKVKALADAARQGGIQF